ncbi:UDP-N-acetylglucosamine 2-epimerase [Pedobacter sp. MW01-1-1]|uniref:UDP-N-acetylglucosamine 2-epimerase n=1 Tax=Pedobacter sp. MW01-1-1 TaxID=3383027 RepID=UPI003FEFCDD8
MRIGVLTSSRADFGIYLPLLNRLRQDSFFELAIIAFGTHLSPFHGETVKQIQNNGFEVKHKVESMLLTDTPAAITTAIGLTTIKFADFWEKNKPEFDLVLCLGDRYEMFAAVTAGIPFQIPFAHIHGGETTLGAIDNVYRHAITLASKYHFVATKAYAERVADITASQTNITVVGALSLDNLSTLKLLSIDEFNSKWGIDLSIRTILCTFHPETVSYEANEEYADELIQAIKKLLPEYQVLVTMPNADTAGNIIRNALNSNFKNTENVFLIENLASQSYFTAMKYCSFLLGNTSSGIIEAASFGKYVINLGNRQKGRAAGHNVIHVKILKDDILAAVNSIGMMQTLNSQNIYWNGGATNKIIEHLKSIS